MDIILVGCGKGGYFHLRCYRKLKKFLNMDIVGVVDINSKNLRNFQILYRQLFNGINEPSYARTLKEISKEVDIGNSIMDICTPNDVHFLCAKESYDLGAKKIMIEKPLTTEISDADKLSRLNATIAVVENYIYSKTTRRIKDILKDNKFQPQFAITKFIKDRRIDSLNKRGFNNGYIPHVFTIELPHQIGIIDYLFGSPIEFIDAWTRDMVVGDRKFSEHGAGALYFVHKKGVRSYNYSFLDGNQSIPIKYREICIHCRENIKIIGYYPTGDGSKLFSSISVYCDNKIIKKYKLLDDSLLMTLKEIIECFGKKQVPVTDVTFGKKIVEIISKGVDMDRGHRGNLYV